MITLGKVSLEEVLPLMKRGLDKIRVTNDDKGDTHIVKLMQSLRMRVFNRSLKCAHCPRVGTKFLLQKHEDSIGPHLNLFATDGTMMTKDHIYPKSKGGPDHISNLQTMCEECNTKKKDTVC